MRLYGLAETGDYEWICDVMRMDGNEDELERLERRPLPFIHLGNVIICRFTYLLFVDYHHYHAY